MRKAGGAVILACLSSLGTYTAEVLQQVPYPAITRECVHARSVADHGCGAELVARGGFGNMCIFIGLLIGIFIGVQRAG